MRLRQPFLHHLARFHQIGAGREDHLDRRKSRHRFRLDDLQPRHTVEQVRLQRHSDQRFNLGAGEAKRFRLHSQRGQRQFGDDVERSVTDADSAEGQKASRANHNEGA